MSDVAGAHHGLRLRVTALAVLLVGCGPSPNPAAAGDAATGESSSGMSTGGSSSGADDTSTEDDGGFLPKSDTLSPDLGAADSHAEDMQPIWNANCILYCHAVGLEPASADLDLFDGAYGSLVGQPSGQLPAMMLITPNEPDQSYLWHKLLGTHLDVGGEGEQMPATGFSLGDDALGRIEAWILAGAPP